LEFKKYDYNLKFLSNIPYSPLKNRPFTPINFKLYECSEEKDLYILDCSWVGKHGFSEQCHYGYDSIINKGKEILNGWEDAKRLGEKTEEIKENDGNDGINCLSGFKYLELNGNSYFSIFVNKRSRNEKERKNVIINDKGIIVSETKDWKFEINWNYLVWDKMVYDKNLKPLLKFKEDDDSEKEVEETFNLKEWFFTKIEIKDKEFYSFDSLKQFAGPNSTSIFKESLPILNKSCYLGRIWYRYDIFIDKNKKTMHSFDTKTWNLLTKDVKFETDKFYFYGEKGWLIGVVYKIEKDWRLTTKYSDDYGKKFILTNNLEIILNKDR